MKYGSRVRNAVLSPKVTITKRIGHSSMKRKEQRANVPFIIQKC